MVMPRTGFEDFIDRLGLTEIAEKIGGPGTRVRDPQLFTRFLSTASEQFRAEARPPAPHTPPPQPPPDMGGRILPREQRQNPEQFQQFRAGAPQGVGEKIELATLPLMAFSPGALAGTIGGTALQQGAERAGAPVPVQVAAGVLGGIASGSPESIPAAFRLAGRGTVRLAQSSADLAAEIRGRGASGAFNLPEHPLPKDVRPRPPRAIDLDAAPDDLGALTPGTRVRVPGVTFVNGQFRDSNRGRILVVGRDGQLTRDTAIGPPVGVPNAVRLVIPQKIARGRRALVERFQLEGRIGGLDPDEMQGAEDFVRALPDELVEELGSSFLGGRRAAIAADLASGVHRAGQYDPLDSLITIYKGAFVGDADRLIIHEVAHHLNQFVPEKELAALRNQFQRELSTTNTEALSHNQRYRYTSFQEWFAETVADKAVRDLYTEPVVKRGLARALGVIREFGVGLYNFLRGRDPRAAERVYRNLLLGRYQGARPITNGARLLLSEQAASEADRIAGARQPANLPQSSAQVAHAATQPPAGDVDDSLFQAWEAFDNTGEITVRELADRVDGLIEDGRAPRSLRSAVDAFEDAVREDFEAAGRSDLASAEDAFTSAVRRVVGRSRQTIPAVPASRSTTAVNVQPILSAPTRSEALTIGGDMAARANTNEELAQIQRAIQQRVAQLEGVQPAAQAAIPPPGGGQPPVQPPGPPVVPPGVPPVTPPTAGGGLTPPPVAPEVTRSLRQAAAMVQQDRPGAVSRMFDKVPTIKSLKDLAVPGRAMPDHILGAHVADNSTRAELTQAFFGSRKRLFNQIDAAFGEGAKEGGQVTGAAFIGTPRQAQNPITGTLKDIADNPELYVLTREQQQVLVQMEARNNSLLDAVNRGYGTQINRFQGKPGGAFLPNVDVSEEALEAIEDFYGNPTGPRSVASGRSKERIFATARERMAADKSFEPQTNVVELLRGLDQSKISAAGDRVFATGAELNSLAKQPTGDAKAHGFKNLVGIGLDRWFAPDEAALILKLRDRSKAPAPVRFISDWNATVLGGDFSPIGIQGGLQMLFHPVETTRIIASGRAAFRPEALSRLVQADPQGWRDFAFATGRSITEGTPQEFSTGFIGRIPKVGPAIGEGNDRMYNFVMSILKNHFDDDVAELMKRGHSRDEALALAGDLNQRIVPVINRSRLGLTSGGFQIRRVPFTSASFLIRPAQLISDATSGFAKVATGQVRHVPGQGRVAIRPTPREELAMRRVTKAAAVILSIAVTSQVIEAQRTGKDPLKAAQAAINPSSPTFASLVVMGRRVGLGGPMRAVVAAISPQPVSGIPFPVPFAGVPRYVQNRLTAGITTPLNVKANLDFRSRPIFKKGKDSAVVSSAKIGAYVAEQFLPVLPQGVASDVRAGDLGPDTAIEAVGQVSGQNIVPAKTVSDLRRAWHDDLETYRKIPSNVREARAKRVQTRDQFRQRNPEVEARLFLAGQVDSFKTTRARTIAVQLMKEHGLSIKDIRSLDEQRFESPERTALRRFFQAQFGQRTSKQVADESAAEILHR